MQQRPVPRQPVGLRVPTRGLVPPCRAGTEDALELVHIGLVDEGAETRGQLGHRLVTGDLDADGTLDLLGVGGTAPGALYIWPGSVR